LAADDYWHYKKPQNANEAFKRQVDQLDEMAALMLVNGEEELAPGIKTYPANGHTPGHQCVMVESEGQTAIITGDLFHNLAQITEQTWCPVFDWNTTKSTESRRMVLGNAQANGWIVCSGHLPVGSNMGRVVEVNGRPAWQAV
jgi:glyoxylase-like metal-dependent hydrolase (beta-lactamase superfamily II)